MREVVLNSNWVDRSIPLVEGECDKRGTPGCRPASLRPFPATKVKVAAGEKLEVHPIKSTIPALELEDDSFHIPSHCMSTCVFFFLFFAIT